MTEKRIEFIRPASYYGNDRKTASYGIMLYEYPQCREVDIYPIADDGERAKCRIGVERDPRVLRDLAAELLRIAEAAELLRIAEAAELESGSREA